MQRMIILLTALGLAALAGCNDSESGVGVSEAHAKGPAGPKTIQIFGDSFFIPPLFQQDPTLPLSSVQSGNAKGFGNATFTAASLTSPGDHVCPLFEDSVLQVPIDITSNVVLTYPDGSQLTLSGVGEGCTNEAVSQFELLFLEEDSTVVLGTGPRFEGASGSWGGPFTSVASQLRGEVFLNLSFN